MPREEQVMKDHQDAKRIAMMTGCQSLRAERGISSRVWGGVIVAESISEPMWFQF